MQNLWSASVRRLCLSVTASATRQPSNPLLSALVRHRQSFASPSTRWYSNVGQFSHQVIEETKEEKPSGVEEVKGDGNPRGYAHRDREVRMDHAFPLDHKDGPTLSPRRVKDDYDPSPTLFVGGISYEATREDIREALRPLGHIVAVRIGLDQEKNSKGFAHIDFETTAEAEKALKYYSHHPVYVLDQQVRLDRASSFRPTNPPSRQLHFSRWEGDGSSLRSHFYALRGEIVDIYFLKNPDPNAPTRPGFIKFRDVETATEALTGFNTPELNLSYARPRNRYRASQNSRPLFKKTG